MIPMHSTRLIQKIKSIFLIFPILITLSSCTVKEVKPIESIQPSQEPTEVIVEITYEPWTIDEYDAILLAQVTWGEARGLDIMRQSAVMWCVLNRLSDDRFAQYNYQTIEDVITHPNQFYWGSSFPVTDELFALANDVLARWHMEQNELLLNSGRTLGERFCWFRGDGKDNYFRDAYSGGNIWNWAFGSPY